MAYACSFFRHTEHACAQSIAAKSPLAVRLGKRAVREQGRMSLADAYEHLSRAMVENMLSFLGRVTTTQDVIAQLKAMPPSS